MNLLHRAKVAYEEGSYLMDAAVSGDLIAATNSLRTVKLYGVDDLQFVGELKGHTDAIRDIRFDRSNGSSLVTFGDAGSVLHWDARSGARPRSLDVRLKCRNSLASGDLSSDGRFLAVGDGTANEGCDIVVYDTRSFARPLFTLEGFHSDDITKVRFHDDRANVLCTGGEDGLLIATDCSASNEDDAITWIFNVENAVNSISFDGARVIAVTSCEEVAVGCLDTGDTLARHERPSEHLYAVMPVGGRMLWGVNGEGYEARCGEMLAAPLGCREPEATWPLLKGGHEDLVRFAYLHPRNDSVLLTGGEDGFVASWGFGERSGQKTASRVQASKEVLDMAAVGLKGSEPPIPEGFAEFAAEDAGTQGTVAPLVEKARKARKSKKK